MDETINFLDKWMKKIGTILVAVLSQKFPSKFNQKYKNKNNFNGKYKQKLSLSRIPWLLQEIE